MKYLTLLLIFILCISSCSYAASDAKSVAILYGQEENSQAYANMLQDSGFKCIPLLKNEYSKIASMHYDLVIVLSCCKMSDGQDFKADFFDKIGNARVLALGDSGSKLFQIKHLRIGNPNGWHGTGSGRLVVFPKSLVNTQFADILRTPNNLVDPQGDTIIEVHPEIEKVRHTGIYDGGEFPEGTFGIGREKKSPHHWVICMQGNYTLWGLNSMHSKLTEPGKQLFVNLCSYLAKLEPQKLIHPKKNYLLVGTHKGTLKGGARDKYYFRMDKPGHLKIQLDWTRDNTMMMIKREPCKRKDGHSPLIIDHNISEPMVNQEINIAIGSFSLEEGADCDYKLTINYFSVNEN